MVRPIGILAILAVVLSACGGTGSTAGTSPGSGNCTGVQYVGAGPIAVPYTDKAQSGFEKEAKAHNRTYQWVQPSNFDMNHEIQLVETALAYTCLKGLGFWTNTPTLFKGVIDKASAKGIPIVTLGCNPGPITSPVCMEIDNVKAFEEIGKQLAARLGGKGNVVVSTGIEPSQDLKFQDLKKYFDANQPNIKILGTVANCDDPLKTVACAENALSQFPTMNAYASTGGFNAVGAAQVFPKHGRKDIIIQALDDDPVVINGIKNGTVAFTLQQSPVLQGQLFFLIPYWMSEESLKPNQKNEYIDSPGFIVDKTNVANYEAAQAASADTYIAQVKSQFFSK